KIPIVEGRGRAAKFVDWVIYVPMESQKVPIRVASFLKLAARVDLTEASEGFAHDLVVSLWRISLRDTRSRWGSCAHDGKLMYSWRLVMAPPYVL
ncbi:YgjP-like metallopeptidase domain-containing protein, partial [Falsihalocynthiibacter sp. S25ZX9]|uniref:YgjP-like metallopeptidase domain-containing protein n=1 Tax=Falsihalocynthiibacter sp. S25ZX9 TaxID=3240870 RepID=UPI0035105BD0